MKTSAMTITELSDLGYLYVRDTGAGRLAALNINGRQLLTDFDANGWSQGWCYATPIEALLALTAWDGVGEPNGWIRHMPSMRRRKYGLEFVQDFERSSTYHWLVANGNDVRAAELEADRLVQVWKHNIQGAKQTEPGRD